MDIRLECFGGVRVLSDGRELANLQQHRARLALLVHLAVEGRVRRDALLATFWPESDAGNARHALRQALYRLRQSLGDDRWMDVNGDELLAGPSLSCDAREFAVAVERGDRQEAARLYRGPFLHAVHLVDTRPWESWVDGQRLHFTRAHRLNCRDWVEERLRGDDLAGALEAASSWVAPDPSEDEAQHRLIELLALSGDRSGAIRQYERFSRLLAGEGLTPLDETTEIYRGLLASPPPAPGASASPRRDSGPSAGAPGGDDGAAGPDAPGVGSSGDSPGGQAVEPIPGLEVIRALGEGAVARVHLARERELGRLVAVKVLRVELATDEIVRARFEREARAAASIRHPNVLAIHRVGRQPNGIPYIVMEYVAGRTLADTLAARGPLAVDEVRRVLGALAAALAAAHRKGVVHRDLRPSNVLWEADTDRVVLADFGLAALLETASMDSARLTKAGERLGDPSRMSPEQVRGEPVTAQSDVYGLGVLGYELLTGTGPFTGADTDVLRAHIVMAPPPPRDLRPDVDAALAEIVVRCLAKVPDQRPRALEVAEALAEPPAVERHLVGDVLPSVETSSTAAAGTPPAAVVSRSAPIKWWSRVFEAFRIGGGRWALLVAGTLVAAALIILLLRIVS